MKSKERRAVTREASARVHSLMGSKVLVSAVFERDSETVGESERRFWREVELDEPRAGWVTGIRWLQDGTYHPAGRQIGPDEWEDPWLHEDAPRTPAALVVWWSTQDPVRVPLGSLREARDGDPEPYTSSGYGDGRSRAAMLEQTSKEMQKLHREEPGMFPRASGGMFARESAP